MAKYEAKLKGNLYTIIADVESSVASSITASKEETSTINFENGKLIVKAYERYSYFGENRLGLTISYLETGGFIYVVAITTGGSQALFFKINTIGEVSFLDKVSRVLDKYRVL